MLEVLAAFGAAAIIILIIAGLVSLNVRSDMRTTERVVARKQAARAAGGRF